MCPCRDTITSNVTQLPRAQRPHRTPSFLPFLTVHLKELLPRRWTVARLSGQLPGAKHTRFLRYLGGFAAFLFHCNVLSKKTKAYRDSVLHLSTGSEAARSRGPAAPSHTLQSLQGCPLSPAGWGGPFFWALPPQNQSPRAWFERRPSLVSAVAIYLLITRWY